MLNYQKAPSTAQPRSEGRRSQRGSGQQQLHRHGAAEVPPAVRHREWKLQRGHGGD